MLPVLRLALRADSHEELVAVGVGYRESTESWSELLRDLERRGMLAPVLRIQVVPSQPTPTA